MYLKLEEKPNLFVDVDDTLVSFPRDYPRNAIVLNEGEPNEMHVVPHAEHIRLIREFKARNFNIIVWSQGGSNWAETIVWHLGLQDIVDVIVGKPTWYLDDKKAEYFMPNANRIWKKDEYKEKNIEEA